MIRAPFFDISIFCSCWDDEAIFNNTASGHKNERFRIAKTGSKFCRPETGVFGGFHFRVSFSDRPRPEKGGPVSDEGEKDPTASFLKISICETNVY